MARRKRHVVPLPVEHNEASPIPAPLLELYNKASLFLDKQSAVHDHYWAVGIHKAIHKAFPNCGGTHTVTTKKRSPRTTRSSCQVPPLSRNHVCNTPDRCQVASLLKEEEEGESP